MTHDAGSGHEPGPPAGDPESGKLADRAERRRLVAEAGHAGDVARIRPALDDPDGGVRATALGALVRAGAADPSDLVARRADPDGTVRRRLATLIARFAPSHERDAAATILLGALLADADPTVVDAAAWAAGEVWQAPEDDRAGGDGGDGDTHPAAIPAAVLEAVIRLVTDHDDSLVREAAVAALGSIGDERGLPAILAACADRGPVRRRAVLALAPFDGPEVDAALERARGDRDWQVRHAADDLMGA